MYRSSVNFKNLELSSKMYLTNYYNNIKLSKVSRTIFLREEFRFLTFSFDEFRVAIGGHIVAANNHQQNERYAK